MSSTDPGAVAVYFAGRDIADVVTEMGAKCSIERIVGTKGAVADQFASLAVAGRYGVTLVSALPTAPVGQSQYRLRVKEAASAQAAALVLDALCGWLSQGLVSIRTSLAPTREAHGWASTIETTLDQPWNKSGLVDVTYTLPDPFWYERAPTPIVLPAPIATVPQRVVVPLGTGPSAPTVMLAGPASSPITLVYRDARGNILATLTLISALTKDEYLIIDTSTNRIVKVSSSVSSTVPTGLGLLSDTVANDYPLLDPEDGDRYASVWGTLEVDDAAHTVSGLASYFKKYR